MLQVCLYSKVLNMRTEKFHHSEHVTAVTVSVKDKLNLSIGVAVGSSIVRILGSKIVPSFG